VKATRSVSRDTLVTIREKSPGMSLMWGVLVAFLAFFPTLCKGNTEALQPQTVKGQVTCFLHMIDKYH